MTDKYKDDLTEEEQAAEAAMMADEGEPEPEQEQDPEPVEAEAEEPEQAAESEKPKAKEKPDGFVPIGALHEAREKGKAAESENAELRRQMQELQQALQSIGRPAQAQQSDEMPDPIISPNEFKDWLGRRMQAEREPVEQMRQQQAQQAQEQRRIAELSEYASTHEQAFRQEYPQADYDGALDHMIGLKTREMQMMGMPEARIAQELRNLRIGTVEYARQNGISPAAYVYNMAKLYGFQEKTTTAQPQQAAQQVERLATAQKQTQSLAGASGRPRDDELTPTKIASMSEAEIAKLSDDQLREIFGG